MSTVVAAWTRSLFAFAEARGLSSRRLLEAMELRDQDLGAGDDRVARDADARLWRYVDRELGDEALGFRFAESLGDASLGIVGLVARASATPAAAFMNAVHYQALLKDDVAARFHVDGDVGTVRWTPSDPGAPWEPALEDACVSACVVLARRWAGPELATPVRIRCRRPRTRGGALLESLLGCPIDFARAATEVSFSREFLESRLATGQAEVLPYLDATADRLLERLGEGPGIQERVKRVFAEVGTDLGRVADALRVSRRTLQRRLAESGVQFEQLADEHRRELVHRLLQDPALTRREIATRAGFSSPRALQRAVQRWHSSQS